MKAISLWQPWASLVACGAKRIETRHWATAHRGELAIHAAQRRPRNEDFQGGLLEMMVQALGVADFRTLPLGAIVATAELASVARFTCAEDIGRLMVETYQRGNPRIEYELAFGNYGLGRYGWVLQNIRPLARPVPTTGHQQLFNVDRTLVEAARQP